MSRHNREKRVKRQRPARGYAKIDTYRRRTMPTNRINPNAPESIIHAIRRRLFAVAV